MPEKEKKKLNGKQILVHNEFLEVLEQLKKRINEYGWGVLDISTINLTQVLARKINNAGILKAA